jgi:hypothetical protein
MSENDFECLASTGVNALVVDKAPSAKACNVASGEPPLQNKHCTTH